MWIVYKYIFLFPPPLFFFLRFKIPTLLLLQHMLNYMASMSYIKKYIPTQADIAVLMQSVAHHLYHDLQGINSVQANMM